MREKSSSSSTGQREKLYINNSLSVRGQKINVGVAQPSRRIATRRHRIEIVDTPASVSQEEEEVKGKRASTIRPKECSPLGDEVVSRQVRKIRETVATEDFERLLISLTGRPEVRHGGRLPAIRTDVIEQIYQQFFGCYYELLHEVVNNNKMSSIT